MDFVRTLTLVARGLEDAGASWAVVGGVALGFHGVARTTFDLDLLVDENDLGPLADLLIGLGYRSEHRWEETSHWLTAAPELCAIDVIHARRPHSRAMLDRAGTVPLSSGVEIPVVAVEDLIGLKVQALVNDPERERAEQVDIRALLEAAAATGKAVDLARVREYFALFDRSDQLARLLEGLPC